MKKIVLAVTLIAAVAGSMFAANQAMAKHVPDCFCTPQFGCSCMDV